MNYGWSKEFSYHCSEVDVGTCIITNITSIILILIFLTTGNLQFETMKLYVIPGIIITGLLMFRIFDDKNDDRFYEKLDFKFKDEKYRVIKGILVFLYFVLSILIAATVTIIVLDKKA
jgi:hypothetical protein